MPKKGWLGQFADLKGRRGLSKKQGVVFLREGVDIPMHTIYVNLVMSIHEVNAATDIDKQTEENQGSINGNQ